MSLEEKETENLFSYGTLQKEAMQLATFGRRLEGKSDSLVGYRLTMIQIEDPDFVAAYGANQRNLQFTGLASDFVEGTVFTVTKKEMEQADAYEPAEYQRVRAPLRSGMEAWVYVSTRQ